MPLVVCVHVRVCACVFVHTCVCVSSMDIIHQMIKVASQRSVNLSQASLPTDLSRHLRTIPKLRNISINGLL